MDSPEVHYIRPGHGCIADAQAGAHLSKQPVHALVCLHHHLLRFGCMTDSQIFIAHFTALLVSKRCYPRIVCHMSLRPRQLCHSNFQDVAHHSEATRCFQSDMSSGHCVATAFKLMRCRCGTSTPSIHWHMCTQTPHGGRTVSSANLPEQVRGLGDCKKRQVIICHHLAHLANGEHV